MSLAERSEHALESRSSRAFSLVLLGVALIPFTATLDYGLGTGSLFRLVPPILLALASAWIVAPGTITLRSPINSAILIFIGISLLSAAYSFWMLDQGLAAQAVGLAVVAGHAVFFWLGRGIDDSRLVLRVFVLAMLVAGILGLVQRILLDTGVCTATSQIPASLENRCLVGGALTYAPELGRIRLPGTAASPWHWSWLLVAGAACAPALLADPQRRWQLLGSGTLIVVLVCSFLSGQRVALVLVPVVAAAAVLAVLRVSKAKIGAAAFIALLAALILPPTRAALADLEDRWQAMPPPRFLLEQWQWAVNEEPGLLGHGPGAATSAARHFGDIVLVESIPAKRLFEIGWLGFGAWVLVVGLLGFGILRRFGTAGPACRALSVYVVLLAVMPWWYPTDTDPGNVLFWLFAGMLLREA